MDENFNENADIQNDSATIETTDTEQVETQETDLQEKDNSQEAQEGTQNQEPDINVPEKIKLGEEEFTAEEIKAWKEQAEAKKSEETANTYQPKDIAEVEEHIKEIDTAGQRAYSNFEAEKNTFIKYFTSVAENPVIQVQDPETGEITEQNQYNYTVEQAINTGIQNGEWQYLERLMPLDQVEKFRKDLKSLYEADGEVKKALNALNIVNDKKAKFEDIAKWDSYIEADKTISETEKHMLNYVKNNFSFDEAGVKAFQAELRHAIALQQNKADLTAENNAAKASMMSSSISGNAQPESGIPNTWDGVVDKMDKDPVWWNKNQSKILEMKNKGLIK